MDAKKRVLTADKIVAGGDALVFDNRRAGFVPYGCPGDVLNVEILREKKDYFFGTISTIKHPSSKRTIPPCPYYFDPEKSSKISRYRYCGGCNFQHIDYTEQLRAKRTIIEDAFTSIAELKHAVVSSVIGMRDPWGYRCKVQMPVGIHKKKYLIGFFKPGTHEIVDIEHCLIQDKRITSLMTGLRRIIEQLQYWPYNEDTHKGWLRHILVRLSHKTGQAQVILITRTDDFYKKNVFINKLLDYSPHIAGVFQNINQHKTNVVLGRETRKIWGSDFIEEQIGHVRYRIKPTAFFQVNPEQTAVLYRTVEELAGLTGKETVIDLYCGSGGIGMYLARKAHYVIGVDESNESIDSALMNTRLNGLSNCTFQQGDVETVIKRIVKEKRPSPVIVLDPPRAGCSEQVLKTLSKLRGRIIYVSCNPATCARDVKILKNYGYRPDCITPVDMFPQTAHIEIVVKLSVQ